VEAGIEEELLTLTALGRGVAGEANEKHRIKRADRLLGNDQLYCESRMYYQRLARQLIGDTSTSSAQETQSHHFWLTGVPFGMVPGTC